MVTSQFLNLQLVKINDLIYVPFVIYELHHIHFSVNSISCKHVHISSFTCEAYVVPPDEWSVLRLCK